MNGAVVVGRLERTEASVADVDRFCRKRRLTEMTPESSQRTHTASTRQVSTLKSEVSTLSSEVSTLSSEVSTRQSEIKSELCTLKSEVRTGGGTIADRSRAIATMSLITATAVAPPPAPAPKMPVSPECAPVISAAFCGPAVFPKNEWQVTKAGATHAVSTEAARSYSACASWRIVPPRARARTKSPAAIEADDRA